MALSSFSASMSGFPASGSSLLLVSVATVVAYSKRRAIAYIIDILRQCALEFIQNAILSSLRCILQPVTRTLRRVVLWAVAPAAAPPRHAGRAFVDNLFWVLFLALSVCQLVGAFPWRSCLQSLASQAFAIVHVVHTRLLCSFVSHLDGVAPFCPESIKKGLFYLLLVVVALELLPLVIWVLESAQAWLTAAWQEAVAFIVSVMRASIRAFFAFIYRLSLSAAQHVFAFLYRNRKITVRITVALGCSMFFVIAPGCSARPLDF